MKKFLAMMIVVGLCAGLAAAESRFSFRVRGGWTSVAGGEINDGLEGLQLYFQETYPVSSGSFKPIRGGYEAGIEVFYRFSPRFSFGIGVGYLKAESQGKMRRGWTEIWSDHDLTPSFTSIPITLTAAYAIPLASRLQARVGAGTGYYPTTFRHLEVSQSVKPAYLYDVTYEYTASKNLIGFHVDLDLEYDLSPRISVFIGARYRLVSGSGWTGESSWDYVENGVSGSGGRTNENIWIYDYDYANQGGTIYRLHQYSTDAPVASPWSVTNVHSAKLDLSGLFLGTGIRVKV